MKRISMDLEARKAAREILEVTEQADPGELKRAYRRAALKYHPDHCGNSPEANKKFVLIKCAYELLAFGAPCSQLLEAVNKWSGVPNDKKYRLDNPWGHFLWWREKFYGNRSNIPKKKHRGNSCI